MEVQEDPPKIIVDFNSKTTNLVVWFSARVNPNYLIIKFTRVTPIIRFSLVR